MSDEIPPTEEKSEAEKELSWGDKMLTGELTPRHRKLAELIAQGKSNPEIAKALDYTESRISILRSNSKIIAEVERIQERIFEETIGSRLRKMAEPSLNIIDNVVSDRSGRIKDKDKIETAKWVLEKLDGKPVQKHEITENILGSLMDRLDALKASGNPLLESHRPGSQVIDVTPAAQEEGLEPQPSEQEDDMRIWVKNFSERHK